MGELTGTLIEMNAKLVMTDWALWMVWVGGFGMVLMVLVTIGVMPSGWKMVVGMGALAVGCAVLFIVGLNEPRVREIRYCANGPVSLEQISTRFDIVKVDGKELVLREK